MILPSYVSLPEGISLLATCDADEPPKVFKSVQWQMSGFLSGMWNIARDVQFIRKASSSKWY